MSIQNDSYIRYPTEDKLIKRALDGDPKAVNTFLNYLSSSNPTLCQIMQKAIHDLKDSRIWKQLLRFLALHRWNEQIDGGQYFSLDASERIGQAIIEIFTQDEHEREKPEKEFALMAGLNDTDSLIQQASAFLLALRGDSQTIPVLAETIETGTREWKLRAIKALAALNDERCARPLLMALVLHQDELHREARRALQNLGPLAEPAWLDALKHPDKHIRWEAARGLGQIGKIDDLGVVDILAEGLLDENYTVRWATADSLAHLGAQAIPAILTILSRYTLTEPTRQAVYHAIHGIHSASTQERVKPLLDALRGPAPDMAVPAVAQRLLLDWDKTDVKIIS